MKLFNFGDASDELYPLINFPALFLDKYFFFSQTVAYFLIPFWPQWGFFSHFELSVISSYELSYLSLSVIWENQRFFGKCCILRKFYNFLPPCSWTSWQLSPVMRGWLFCQGREGRWKINTKKTWVVPKSLLIMPCHCLFMPLLSLLQEGIHICARILLVSIGQD